MICAPNLRTISWLAYSTNGALVILLLKNANVIFNGHIETLHLLSKIVSSPEKLSAFFTPRKPVDVIARPLIAMSANCSTLTSHYVSTGAAPTYLSFTPSTLTLSKTKNRGMSFRLTSVK